MRETGVRNPGGPLSPIILLGLCSLLAQILICRVTRKVKLPEIHLDGYGVYQDLARRFSCAPQASCGPDQMSMLSES